MFVRGDDVLREDQLMTTAAFLRSVYGVFVELKLDPFSFYNKWVIS